MTQVRGARVRRVRFVVGAVAAMLAVVACRGSVERLYDDAIEGELQPGADGGEPTFDGGGSLPLGPATIGGTVVGLVGAGLVLQNNGADDVEVKAGGAFSFPGRVEADQLYAVTVRSQPTGPMQTCEVTRGAGTARGVDVLDVLVTCGTNGYPVGGNVVGLVGSGLVLQNNGGNDLTVSDDGVFAFAQAVPSGSDFNVKIKTQPTSPTQTCSVSGSTGTVVSAAVDSVVVNCGTNTYTVGGTVSGLAGTLVLRNNGGNDRTLTANGGYAFSLPVSSGAGYNVTVKTQPAYPPVAQTCTVTNPTGTIGSANVTNVNVACSTNKYTVGGNVSGLTGTGLVLRNNGGDDRAITANGAFKFATSVASGSPYAVSIRTHPTNQICAVSGGAGTITTANVSSVGVSCRPGQNFDGVTAPNLPAGWQTEIARGATGDVGWVTSTLDKNTSPNSAFVADYDHRTNITLNSMPIAITRATATLSFWTRYETDFRNDGGVLEISIDGGGFEDILSAGGSFTAGGYNDTINLLFSTSTIAGRKAWTGNGSGPVQVNLPAAAAGKTIVLRWRIGTNDSKGGNGWLIDTVLIDP